MRNHFSFFRVFVFFFLFLIAACKPKNNAPTIAFLDAFEDNTIAQARKGFFDALEKNGFSEKQKTLNVIYRNAQGSATNLLQMVQYAKSQEVNLIATCPTLSTITALQNAKDIPVFMMVSPTPQIMALTNKELAAPKNLFGVADNVDYIDTSFLLMKDLVKPKGAVLKIGMLYNPAETQSDAAMQRIRSLAKTNNIELTVLPVTNSSETLLVTQSLLSQNIDAFFANPDNVVFSGFETIITSCNKAKVPVFTSEAGLVARGAVAAYGANLYAWGYQTGLQAAVLLKTKSANTIKWEMVQKRERLFNAEAAKYFGYTMPAGFELYKP